MSVKYRRHFRHYGYTMNSYRHFQLSAHLNFYLDNQQISLEEPVTET